MVGGIVASVFAFIKRGAGGAKRFRMPGRKLIGEACKGVFVVIVAILY
jgi:hypothetical protein